MTAVAPGVIPTEKGHWNKHNIKSKHAKNYLKIEQHLEDLELWMN